MGGGIGERRRLSALPGGAAEGPGGARRQRRRRRAGGGRGRAGARVPRRVSHLLPRRRPAWERRGGAGGGGGAGVRRQRGESRPRACCGAAGGLPRRGRRRGREAGLGPAAGGACRHRIGRRCPPCSRGGDAPSVGRSAGGPPPLLGGGMGEPRTSGREWIPPSREALPALPGCPRSALRSYGRVALRRETVRFRGRAAGRWVEWVPRGDEIPAESNRNKLMLRARTSRLHFAK